MKSLLNRAIYLLSQRDHSEQELRRKLSAQSTFNRKNSLVSSTNNEMLAEHITQVIQYCIEHNWINDSQYAEKYIRVRSEKGYGPQRIKMELIQRGIIEKQINQALDSIDIHWNDLASKLIRLRFGSSPPSCWKEKAKVMRFLIYRGFPPQILSEIFD